MKVPKMYKSSDRYNAGTDVIYDDESKLQYAPFIYATAESGDNGGDGGGDDDEEGEDTMLVTFDENTRTIDKTFNELKAAVNSGKVAVMVYAFTEDMIGLYYLTYLTGGIEADYYAYFTNVYPDSGNQNAATLEMLTFISSTASGVLTIEQ